MYTSVAVAGDTLPISTECLLDSGRVTQWHRGGAEQIEGHGSNCSSPACLHFFSLFSLLRQCSVKKNSSLPPKQPWICPPIIEGGSQAQVTISKAAAITAGLLPINRDQNPQALSPFETI